MASKLDGLFDGQVGEFWSLDKSFEFGAVLRGFVRRNNSGLVVLSTLDEGNGLSDSNDANSVRTPRYVAGLTASTGTVLLRPTGTSRSKNYGGHRASTRDFRFRAITSNVLVSRLKSGKLLGLEVRFAEMLRWAQMPIMHTDRQVREDGRLKSVTIRLDSQDREDVVRLHDGLSLRIHPYWSYESGDSYGRIETPLAICARSSRPQEVAGFIEPLTDFRLLLSLAHGELVPCDSARARFDYRTDAGKVAEHWSPLWDQQLMEKPDRVSKTMRPKFSYASIGGAVGVARWLKFSRTHARFIRPVTMQALRPGMVVTTRLMELYAAIEYYVAESRRAKRPWATRGKIAEATVLGRHGGREFKKLVGDPDRWADVIHWLNNRTKHNPVDEDPVDIHWLNLSAEALITIVSLNHASRRKLAASQFVGDIRTERIGREVRDLLSRYPEELPKSY